MKTLALRPTLPAVLHANRKTGQEGRPLLGTEKNNQLLYPDPLPSATGTRLTATGRSWETAAKPGDRHHLGGGGGGSDASSLHSVMVLRRQGLGPGTRKC